MALDFNKAPSVMVVNGPNLNMLGRREPDIYGTQTLDDIELMCRRHARDRLDLTFYQSNHEGDLVDVIQTAFNAAISGLVINAGGYTHTSVAIHDALKLLLCPIVEVHLSDPQTREPFRHFSYISPVASHIVKGHGAQGYIMALDYLLKRFAGT